MNVFRYPGGKAKARRDIIDRIRDLATTDMEYREPFIGGGSVSLEILSSAKTPKAWINDFDTGISAIWTAIAFNHDRLKALIMDYKPTLESHYKIRSELMFLESSEDQHNKKWTKPSQQRPVVDWDSEEQVVSLAFKKLVMHQTTYSGLGVIGGVLGGHGQKSAYKIDCRWTPKNICVKIDKANARLSKTALRNKRCGSDDFELLIADDTCPAIMYLDPPYYLQGNKLYQFGFAEQDHVRLAEALKRTKHKWVLSYDDCKEIRDLYGDWARIDQVQVRCAIPSAKKNQKNELVISSA